MKLRAIKLIEPIESEFERVDSATRAAEDVLGFPGRMLSGSKSGYSASRPDGEPVFNANVCTREDGKIWYGDLDLATKDAQGLQSLADALGRDVYVLREMDARFENEEKPLFEKAVQVFHVPSAGPGTQSLDEPWDGRSPSAPES